MVAYFSRSKRAHNAREIVLKNFARGAENVLFSSRYAEKKELSNQPYVEGKQGYSYSRDQEHYLIGSRTKEVKNGIKRLENILRHNRTVYCAWCDNFLIQMLFSNGALVNICLDNITGDIIRMTFDKYFIGKLISESITDVILTRKHILISYDINQITFVFLQVPNFKNGLPQKINKLDPKIFNIIINGSSTRKMSRHLACNESQNLCAIWTKSSQNEVYPWRPTVRDQDRANVHIYKLGENKMDLFCYYWTENDPIDVQFSKIDQNQIRSIEEKISRKVISKRNFQKYGLNK